MTESHESSSSVLTPSRPNGAGRRGLIMLVVGIIILIAVVTFLVYMIFSFPSNGSAWQAVFLTNGRTYFGQLVKQNSDIVVLQNVYYIQVQQPAPVEEGAQPQQPQLTLVNITEELHAPENEMKINWSHVLFMQKLSQDSQVVASIEELQQAK